MAAAFTMSCYRPIDVHSSNMNQVDDNIHETGKDINNIIEQIGNIQNNLLAMSHNDMIIFLNNSVQQLHAVVKKNKATSELLKESTALLEKEQHKLHDQVFLLDGTEPPLRLTSASFFNKQASTPNTDVTLRDVGSLAFLQRDSDDNLVCNCHTPPPLRPGDCGTPTSPPIGYPSISSFRPIGHDDYNDHCD